MSVGDWIGIIWGVSGATTIVVSLTIFPLLSCWKTKLEGYAWQVEGGDDVLLFSYCTIGLLFGPFTTFCAITICILHAKEIYRLIRQRKHKEKTQWKYRKKSKRDWNSSR